MKDRDGKELGVGDAVLFKMDRDDWCAGTIRKISSSPWKGEIGAWCDDGDPANTDLTTNGFRRATVALAHEIRKATP